MNARIKSRRPWELWPPSGGACNSGNSTFETMGRVRSPLTLCCPRFSHSDNYKKSANLVDPCNTKTKKQKDNKQMEIHGDIVEYESCCIDGFVIYSFATAEEQHGFSSSTSLKGSAPQNHPVSFTKKTTKKQKNLEEMVFIDCGSLFEENQAVTSSFRKYSCSSCGKAFMFLSSLEFHLRNAFPKNSVALKCEFCPIISYGSDTMRMHVRHLHGRRLYDQYSSDQLEELFDEQIPACKRQCDNAANI